MRRKQKLIPKTNGARAASAVTAVPSRAIADLTRLLLFVRAGGRCEFDGCNKYLIRHGVTRIAGNFAQMAHIVAFSAKGPRGTKKRSGKNDANSVGNLMLLCPECHKLIDTRPDEYTVKTLKAFKRR